MNGRIKKRKREKLFDLEMVSSIRFYITKRQYCIFSLQFLISIIQSDLLFPHYLHAVDNSRSEHKSRAKQCTCTEAHYNWWKRYAKQKIAFYLSKRDFFKNQNKTFDI